MKISTSAAHRRHDISDHVWGRIEPLLRGRKGLWGGIARDNRLFSPIHNITGDRDHSGFIRKTLKQCLRMFCRLSDIRLLLSEGHCCKVIDGAAFCLIERPYISKVCLPGASRPADDRSKNFPPGLCVAHASLQSL